MTTVWCLLMFNICWFKKSANKISKSTSVDASTTMHKRYISGGCTMTMKKYYNTKFSVLGKFPPDEFLQIKLSPGRSALENPPWWIPIQYFLQISDRIKIESVIKCQANKIWKLNIREKTSGKKSRHLKYFWSCVAR